MDKRGGVQHYLYWSDRRIQSLDNQGIAVSERTQNKLSSPRFNGYPPTASRGLMALALSPLVVLLASGTRLIIIGNYDTTTATTMAASGGLGQTILGTVVPLLPAFLPAALVFLAVFRQWGLLLFAAGATAFLSPAYATARQGWDQAYPIFRVAVDHAWHLQWHALWHDSRLLVWCAALGAGFAFWDHLLWRNPTAPVNAIVVAGICALTLLFIQHVYRVSTDLDTISETLRRPWLPAEKIELKSGEPRVVYILSTDKEWHTVLSDSTRTISYIRVGDVTNRTVCRAGTLPPAVPPPLIHLKPVPVTPIPACPSGH